MMFFGDNRSKPEQTFQESEYGNDHHLYKEKVTVLLGKKGEMSVVLTLSMSKVIILPK